VYFCDISELFVISKRFITFSGAYAYCKGSFVLWRLSLGEFNILFEECL
jgi:hypothetical protein